MAVVGFGPQGVLVDARSRHVFTLDAVGVDHRGKYVPTGAVSVLDAGTGTVLRSVPVGNNPTWMAADERTTSWP
jgi:YVTN family beta-propeller protein